MNFRERVLKKLASDLETHPEALALWEGGSAANSTSDPYSDIDVNILAASSPERVFHQVESSLRGISEITHVWNEPKSVWPDLTQKVYFLKDSPKHFFVDVAVFPRSSPHMIDEFMQVERHGQPVVHFDKSGLIRARAVHEENLQKKRQKRLGEMLEAFPVYRTEVFKEIDRGHTVDAIGFYHGAMLRPLVEVLGMIYRPARFDFGLRYLQRSLPPELYKKIEGFAFVSNIESLRLNAIEVEKMFYSSVEQVKKQYG